MLLKMLVFLATWEFMLCSAPELGFRVRRRCSTDSWNVVVGEYVVCLCEKVSRNSMSIAFWDVAFECRF
ncbi:hypothetical protein M758_4G197600 [Ceratodon purpureus]|nr:hypothetical protein M758_4G197600 [Ceratodon purpureus]